MNHTAHLAIVAATLITTFSTGCETKFARNFEKQVELTKDGIVDTKTNIEEGLSHTCQEAPPVSQNADEVLRLVSSEDQTLFIIDGKEMGRAKQLKVCIDSSAEHSVTAEPPGCDAKIEKIKPPYDFPIYEFRFMLAECKPITEATTQTITPVTRQSSKRNKRKTN